MTIYCGIDPGLGGAIGFINDSHQVLAVLDMPVLPNSTGRRQIDAHLLARVLVQWKPDFVMVERVGPRPREGAVGAFSFGYSFGCILGVLAALNISHDLVQPGVWKRRAGIPPGSDKRASIATCKRVLPDSSDYLTRIKDDGRAEALLLAVHCAHRETNT